MMGASCVLPSILLLHITVYPYHYCLNRKRWVLPACFLLYYCFKAKLDGNSHYFANFSRKHAESTHGCFLRASFCYIINGS